MKDKMGNDCTNMLETLPAGEWKIIKHVKNGTYLQKGKIKIFIPKNNVDIEQMENESLKDNNQ